MIKSLRIGTKIYLAAGALVGTILITNSFAFMLAKDVGVRIDAIAEEDVPLTEAVTKLTIGQLEQAIIFEQAQISHLERSLEHATHDDITKTVDSPTTEPKPRESPPHDPPPSCSNPTKVWQQPPMACCQNFCPSRDSNRLARGKRRTPRSTTQRQASQSTNQTGHLPTMMLSMPPDTTFKYP